MKITGINIKVLGAPELHDADGFIKSLQSALMQHGLNTDITLSLFSCHQCRNRKVCGGGKVICTKGHGDEEIGVDITNDAQQCKDYELVKQFQIKEE